MNNDQKLPLNKKSIKVTPLVMTPLFTFIIIPSDNDLSVLFRKWSQYAFFCFYPNGFTKKDGDDKDPCT